MLGYLVSDDLEKYGNFVRKLIIVANFTFCTAHADSQIRLLEASATIQTSLSQLLLSNGQIQYLV
jgi:hypothetical protein